MTQRGSAVNGACGARITRFGPAIQQMVMSRRAHLLLSLALFVPTGCALRTAEAVDESIAADTPSRSIACPGESASASALRVAIDRVRASAGLAPIHCDVAASRAASGHCRYLATNHEFSHVETPGKPGFIGVTMQDRLAHEGFGSDPAGEVLASLGGSHALLDARGWLNSVYHRSFFLRSETTVFGYGDDDGCAIVDFGRVKGVAAPKSRIVWPPDGSTDVPRSFRADRETPNPVAGAEEVGAPVSFITSSVLSRIDAKLEGPNGLVAATVITAESDRAKLVRAGEVHLVPKAPLAAHARHRAVFTAWAGNEAIVARTSFVTGD